MDINVRVTVELGRDTREFFAGVMEGQKAIVRVLDAGLVKEPEGKLGVGGEMLTRDGEMLDEIKTEVAKFVKKGYSADVKALLAHFDAPRVSMLKPEQFAEFRAAVDRYARGESMERIINDLLA